LSKEKSLVWQHWLSHRARVIASTQPAILGEISEVIVDGIEAQAGRDPVGQIAALHRDLIALLQIPNLQDRPNELKRIREVYREARELTFPAHTAFLKHSQELNGLTTNASLLAVDRDLLIEIDLMAHVDPTYMTFVSDMVAQLEGVQSAPDAVAYSQFFEIFAEAMVLH